MVNPRRFDVDDQVTVGRVRLLELAVLRRRTDAIPLLSCRCFQRRRELNDLAQVEAIGGA
jgi:hypothetical protein